MCEHEAGYALCRARYTPADPILQRPDAPSFDCTLHRGHVEPHCIQVAPGLLFRWAREGVAFLQYAPVEPAAQEQDTSLWYDSAEVYRGPALTPKQAEAVLRGWERAGMSLVLAWGPGAEHRGQDEDPEAVLREFGFVPIPTRAPEQDVEGLVADIARCIPAPGAVCVEGFPRKATNVLVSVSLLERVLAALRGRSTKEEG